MYNYNNTTISFPQFIVLNCEEKHDEYALKKGESKQQ